MIKMGERKKVIAILVIWANIVAKMLQQYVRHATLAIIVLVARINRLFVNVGNMLINLEPPFVKLVPKVNLPYFLEQ